MKFDFCIGNPPYHEASAGNKPSDKSVYNDFMDAAYDIAQKVELITPARFLFNAGATPKKWNAKMLQDNHFKILDYKADSSLVFGNTDIKGGVAVHYRDNEKDFGAIGTFTMFEELNSILRKVRGHNESSLSSIIFNQNKFSLSVLYADFPELQSYVSSYGNEKRMTSGCLSYTCFHDKKICSEDIQILGVIGNKRNIRYINRKYIQHPCENLEKYKVIVPANNGSGALGEVMSTPLIGEPLIGYTQTFIGIGAFDNKDDCVHAFKYIKSKFCRVMLGVLKITQNGKKETWKYVPLQDFTDKSDINWNTSIANIDQQLYRKYGLSQEEINFIETHVKDMA